jgi:hypothetical protein
MSNTSPTTAGQTAVRSEYKLKTTGDFALPADWSLYRPDGFVLPRLTPRPAAIMLPKKTKRILFLGDTITARI